MQQDERYRAQKEALSAHYAGGDVVGAVRTALKNLAGEAGLTPEDTAPFDDPTSGAGRRRGTGRPARSPGRPAGAGCGCGIGGPSRHLAWTYGCRVTGIDLTAPYCEAACLIAERLGLGGALTYLHGDALNLPFPKGRSTWSGPSTRP
jgi:SAM-dependent methyltransferase